MDFSVFVSGKGASPTSVSNRFLSKIIEIIISFVNGDFFFRLRKGRFTDIRVKSIFVLHRAEMGKGIN